MKLTGQQCKLASTIKTLTARGQCFFVVVRGVVVNLESEKDSIGFDRAEGSGAD
jgi:hypothetical protein